MHEQDPQELQREPHPGVYEAAQRHWEALADPVGLQEEFASNYLGCWPNKDNFGADLARDTGQADDAGRVLAEQLGSTGELQFVPDEHGVHVFVHPVGPEPGRLRAVHRKRHLQLVSHLEANDEQASTAGSAARTHGG